MPLGNSYFACLIDAVGACYHTRIMGSFQRDCSYDGAIGMLRGVSHFLGGVFNTYRAYTQMSHLPRSLSQSGSRLNSCLSSDVSTVLSDSGPVKAGLCDGSTLSARGAPLPRLGR